MKRILKTILIVYLVLCAIGTCCFFGIGNVIYNIALVRNTPTQTDNSVFSGGMTENRTWLEENGREMYINSDDGLTLHGYLAENPLSDNRYAVVCHGYSSKATDMSYFAKSLYDMNFSVLAVDARAHGKSEGSLIGMGYLEKRDIILWINEITKADPDAKFILYGISMGAATVLFTSGESDLPSSVKAVISDCAYSRVYEQIGCTVRGYIPVIPDFPIVDSASVVCELRGGYSFRDASCIDAVKRSRTPTLFIHGSSDYFVPFYMLDILYNNAGCPKEKLVIDGAAHAQCAATNPDLYWSTIKNFINNNTGE